jgi:hypothetical protein
VHGPPPKLPEPSDCNPTVPVGVLTVPADVSVTVATHVVVRPTATGLGEQPTVVLAERGPTLTASLPWPSSWVESPL